MLIKITDIPPEGRHIEFPLELEELNSAMHAPTAGAPSKHFGKGRRSEATPDAVSLPERFTVSPQIFLDLSIEGRTVLVEGKGRATLATVCARCAEETTVSFDVPISVVLKPFSVGSAHKDDVEDVQLGYYDGKEVDCAETAKEFILRAIPYQVLCRQECRGLCSSCGTNLNYGTCSCVKEEAKANPFAKLLDLKIQ